MIRFLTGKSILLPSYLKTRNRKSAFGYNAGYFYPQGPSVVDRIDYSNDSASPSPKGGSGALVIIVQYQLGTK